MEEPDPPRGTFTHGWPYWQKERMTLRPHGFSVLIQPDAPPERTDSGLVILPEQQDDYVATSGVVVAVGKGSKRDCHTRMWVAGRVMRLMDEHGIAADHPVYRAVSDLYARSDRRIEGEAAAVAVGDRVVFPAESGLTVKDEDGTEYVLMDEDKIAIIVEESVA